MYQEIALHLKKIFAKTFIKNNFLETIQPDIGNV